MREISYAKFIKLYEKRKVYDIIYVKNRVIARSVEGQALNPKRHEVVYAKIK